MWRTTMKFTTMLGAVAVLAGAAGAGASQSSGAAGSSAKFTHSTRITNPYLPISRFHQCKLAGPDQGTQLEVTRTLLDRTKQFPYHGQMIEAAEVKDVVIGDGKLIEKTLDYFAQDDAGNVYYLGEDVNEYRNGKLINHEGQWRLGRDTNKIGVLMPAHPKVGDVFKSESVPGIVHETDHVVASGGTSQIEGQTYRNVIKVRENARPPRETEFKTYSRGTGVITEANGGVHLLGCS